jgi:hypothetical protein
MIGYDRVMPPTDPADPMTDPALHRTREQCHDMRRRRIERTTFQLTRAERRLHAWRHDRTDELIARWGEPFFLYQLADLEATVLSLRAQLVAWVRADRMDKLIAALRERIPEGGIMPRVVLEDGTVLHEGHGGDAGIVVIPNSVVGR